MAGPLSNQYQLDEIKSAIKTADSLRTELENEKRESAESRRLLLAEIEKVETLKGELNEAKAGKLSDDTVKAEVGQPLYL